MWIFEEAICGNCHSQFHIIHSVKFNTMRNLEERLHDDSKVVYFVSASCCKLIITLWQQCSQQAQICFFFQTSKVTLLNLQLSDILPIRFSILWRLDTNSHIRLFNTDPGLIEHRWEFGSGEDGKERKRGRRRGVWNRVKFFKSLSLLNLHA